MLRTTYLCILVVFLTDGAQAYYGGRCSQEATRTHRVSIDLYIMSKCPYGAQAVEALPTVVDEIGFAMDLSIDYIGNYDPKAQLFGSLHGATEVEGDAWQLCAMNHYRSNMSEWVDFLACMSKDYKRIPTNVRECSDAVGLDYSLLESCMHGTESDQLLKASITKAATNHITLSPTFVIGGRQYVGERTPTHLINAICYSEGEWSDSVSSGGDDGESVRLWWSVAGVVVTLGLVTGVVGGFGAYLWRRHRRRQSGVSQENGGYQMVDVVVEAKTVN